MMVYGLDAYNQSITGNKSKTLNSIATDSDHIPCVVYGLDRASFNQGINAQYDFSVEQDLAQTLISKGPGGVMTTETNIGGEVPKWKIRIMLYAD